MAFLDLFKIKKEVPPKTITPIPKLEPIQRLQPIKPIAKSFEPSANKEFKKIPEYLPKFPIDLSKKAYQEKEPSFNFNVSKIEPDKPLPRMESEHSVKDFVSSDTMKPFIPEFEDTEPFERIKPPSLGKLEEDFKPKLSFKREIKSLEKPTHFELHEEIRKPLFIRTDQYKDVKKNMTGFEEILKEADEIYYRITNLKEDQDSQFNLFHKKIEEIQRKLIHVDKTIFEKGDENR